MANFKFTATRASGESYESVREAPDKFALYKILRDEGDQVIRATPVVEKKALSLGGFNISFERVTTAEKITFARNLGAMLKAGLALSRSLAVLERQTRKKKFKKILENLNDSIKRGSSFFLALSAHPKIFSNLFVSMVRAGEESGKLSDALLMLALQMNQTYLLQKKVRGAMIYPTIILCVIVIIAIVMMIFVVPTLTATFKDLHLQLPVSTRIVIFVSDFMKNHFFFFIAFVFVLIGGGLYAFRQPKVRRGFDYFILHIPLIGNLVRETNSARTARTLSSLLSSGVDIVIAITITRDVLQNFYYKEVLGKAAKNIERGEPISGIFMANEHLYPAFVGEMMNVGEETGKLGEMLENMAVYYEQEVDQKTKDLSTVIEPFLMVAIGIAVGFFAVSMLGPMYSLVDAI